MYEVIFCLAPIVWLLTFAALFAAVQTFPETVKAFDKKFSNFISGVEQ